MPASRTESFRVEKPILVIVRTRSLPVTRLQEPPGLSKFRTVSTALYKDRKLFKVHSIPGTIEKTVVRGIIPMPKMSTDRVPRWPDYKVWLIDGRYYKLSDCYGN